MQSNSSTGTAGSSAAISAKAWAIWPGSAAIRPVVGDVLARNTMTRNAPGKPRSGLQGANCKGDHPAWAGQYPIRQEAATRAREAFLTRSTQFAEDHSFPLFHQADEPWIVAKRKT